MSKSKEKRIKAGKKNKSIGVAFEMPCCYAAQKIMNATPDVQH